MSARASKLRFVLVALAVLGIPAAIFLPLDIRPKSFVTSPDHAAKGRAIVARGIEAQGGEAAWKRLKTLEVEIHDAWHIGAFRLYMPLAENDIRLRGLLPLHQWGRNSTWTALTGEDSGAQFGVVDAEGWYEDQALTGPGTRFYAMTMEYLLTLAFRIPEADVVTWLDTAERSGELHDRVFVTWGAPDDPDVFIDQYIAYYRQSDGLLTGIECTVRDFGPFIIGGVDYRSWRTVDGITLPSEYGMPLVDLQGPVVHTVKLTHIATTR